MVELRTEMYRNNVKVSDANNRNARSRRVSVISVECQCCCNQEGDSSASLLKSLGKMFLCFKLVLHKTLAKDTT